MRNELRIAERKRKELMNEKQGGWKKSNKAVGKMGGTENAAEYELYSSIRVDNGIRNIRIMPSHGQNIVIKK